jgi:PIN domain nuclease of toxin-antitoxin system
MKLLLDTVTLYRAATSPRTLSDTARASLEDQTHSVFVSLVSAWELAIKASLGKLALPSPIADFFPQVAHDLLAQQVGLELSAIAKLTELPHHHGDPFDRLLVAQALVLQCAIVTNDTRIAAYGVRVIW